jgi:DNA-3-methyladenine glycosylase
MTRPGAADRDGVLEERAQVSTAAIRYNPAMPRPLARSFYARPTLTVARDLLGSVLARRHPETGAILKGVIVESEAYVGEEDKACHARAGRTPRTSVMYGRPGHAYVYFTYGMHYMLNVVTEPEGSPAAVLIRAVEPLEGLEDMRRARGLDRPHLLTSGPGKLCQAFALDLGQNGADLLGSQLWIEPGRPIAETAVATSARIGCETAAAPWDLIPWRFYVAESRFVTPGRASLPRSADRSRRTSRSAPNPAKLRGSQTASRAK